MALSFLCTWLTLSSDLIYSEVGQLIMMFSECTVSAIHSEASSCPTYISGKVEDGQELLFGNERTLNNHMILYKCGLGDNS